MIEFLMPSLGADMEAGTLTEWKKKPGDAVKHGDIIAQVETQKGLIDIEVFDDGIIGELLIQEGARVPVGTVMALINSKEGVETKKETIAEKKTLEIQPTEEKIIESIAEVKLEKKGIKASPLAKRIASDNKIDLSQVTGTGPDGAITKEDVDHALLQRAEIQKREIAETKATENVNPAPALQGIRSAVAAAMSKSNREIPHYYLEKNIDMSKALSWLREANRQRPVKGRLLPVALLIKATAKSLVEFPDLNAVWENDLQLKKEINIGFVVSLRTGGIIVPAIHQVDSKNIDEIMEALNDIILRARALKLRSSDLSSSTITITNIGEGGVDTIFGVIYPPQVAIIGFGTISEQPFAENGMVGIHPVLHVTLSGDHRATDGLTGSRFLATLNKYLQNPESL